MYFTILWVKVSEQIDFTFRSKHIQEYFGKCGAIMIGKWGHVIHTRI